MDVASICCNVLAPAFVCRMNLSLTPLQAKSRRKAFPSFLSRKDNVVCFLFFFFVVFVVVLFCFKLSASVEKVEEKEWYFHICILIIRFQRTQDQLSYFKLVRTLLIFVKILGNGSIGCLRNVCCHHL